MAEINNSCYFSFQKQNKIFPVLVKFSFFEIQISILQISQLAFFKLLYNVKHFYLGSYCDGGNLVCVISEVICYNI